MATSSAISKKELERIANAAYVGKTIKVMLCNNAGTTTYDAESTVTQWQTKEVSGNGYIRFSELVSSGSYNLVTGRFELPEFIVPFTATAAYSYNSVVVYIDGETYIHSVITESPNIALASGQTQTYKLTLAQDD